MRPLAVNVTEIHCQTIFLLTIGALAPPDCGAPTVQHPQPFCENYTPESHEARAATGPNFG